MNEPSSFTPPMREYVLGEEEIERFRQGDILLTDAQAELFCDLALKALRSEKTTLAAQGGNGTLATDAAVAPVAAAPSATQPPADLYADELKKDAARYRFLRSNVRAEDKMVGYCVRYFQFETTCDKRCLDDALDAAMHPERT